MNVVVCGCNRTGTSFLARKLVEAGLKIEEPQVPANAGNPDGYFEPQEFKDLVRRYNGPLPFWRGRTLRKIAKLMDRPGDWVWKYPGAVFMLPALGRASPRMLAVAVHREKTATIRSMVRHCELVGVRPRSQGSYSRWYDRAESAFASYRGRKLLLDFTELTLETDSAIERVLVATGR